MSRPGPATESINELSSRHASGRSTRSPGVARQYCGTLGKVANCQIGVSVHAVTDTASCPLDWRLFVPTSWDDQAVDEADRPAVATRRTRCGIPEDERHRPK